MGITDLWGVLAPAFEPRIRLSHFVANFIAVHGRPPRIALDAYVFIHSVADYSEDPHVSSAGIVRAFAAKINALNTLNISYVVVFDGKLKPAKLRHGNPVQESSYEKDYAVFAATSPENYAEDIPAIRDIKNLLLRLQVDFVQAPAEAEAECCLLQKVGIVDYVLSNDSDVFVFGASAVLRNFKKLAADLLLAPPELSSQEYYVTPVLLSSITEKLGLDTSRMVLLATLRGGDYSKGVDAIGIRGAVNIALCGTPFAPFFKRSPTKAEKKEAKFSDPPPDFTKQLMGCFVAKDITELGACAGMFCAEVRRSRLSIFLHNLNHHIRLRPRDVFGRGKTIHEDVDIDEYSALLYLFPFVNKALFKFVPGTLSFGERDAVPSDLRSSPDFLTGNREEISIERSNVMFGGKVGTLMFQIPEVLGHEVVAKSKFSALNWDLFNSLPALYVPSAFMFNMKHLVAKFITHTHEVTGLNEAIAITNTKNLDGTILLMVKFSPLTLRDLMGIESDLEESPTHKNSLDNIWLPKVLVKWLNPEIVEAFEHEQAMMLEEKRVASRKSPKKYHQATTLDSLVTNSSTLGAPAFNTLVKKSPKRTKAKKRPGLERGQSQILEYFGTSLQGSPKMKAVSPKNIPIGATFKEMGNHYLSLERSINLAPKLSDCQSNVPELPGKRPNLDSKITGQKLEFAIHRSPKRPLSGYQESEASPTKKLRGERAPVSTHADLFALHQKLPISSDDPIETIPSDDTHGVSPIRIRRSKMVVLESESDLQLAPIQAGDILNQILLPLLNSSDDDG